MVVIGNYRKYAAIDTIEEVTLASVRNHFFYGRTVRAWSPGTCAVVFKALKVFFRWCGKQGYIQFDPTADVELPKPAKKIPINLSEADALRLLEVVYNYPYECQFLRFRNHAIFATFVFAGLRLQELLNLNYTDVDIEQLTLLVREGKGKKDRKIPISYTLAQSLKRYMQERKRLNKSCPEFFTSLHLNCGYTLSGLKRLVLKIRAASGIAFSIHKLRHTFATLMYESGCEIYALSRLLGHSSIETTKIYVHSSVENLRAQIAKHPLNNFVK